MARIICMHINQFTLSFKHVCYLPSDPSLKQECRVQRNVMYTYLVLLLTRHAMNIMNIGRLERT